ncbi:MAG: hypothetical protein K2I93_07485 [Oscillospiraceae bacterium]|nr:hypothetical protein [Oscillospiraceae bacterium]
MDQYESSLARVCLELGGISCLYEDNVPENFMVPSLYFPPHAVFPSASALGSYQSSYTIYAKVFAATKREAEELAEKIVQGIMLQKCLIPVFEENGADSGNVIKLEPPSSKGIDEGMAQITLTYKIIRVFKETKYPSVQSVEINKNYD